MALTIHNLEDVLEKILYILCPLRYLDGHTQHVEDDLAMALGQEEVAQTRWGVLKGKLDLETGIKSREKSERWKL